MTHNISFPISFLALAEDIRLGIEIWLGKKIHTCIPERDVKICNGGSQETVSFCQSVVGWRGSVARPPSGLLTVTPEEQPSGRRPPRSAAVFRAINTSISVKREGMESSCDYNREQMAGSAGHLEVTPLAKLINKVLLFFSNSYHSTCGLCPKT